MPRPDNPTLVGEDWEKYKAYIEVPYDAAWGWNSRHWLCPICNYSNSVMHHKCDACFREKVKKTTGYNRNGNPIQKWVMLCEPL